MVLPINTALSGLAAAGTRLAVSANNIANQESTSSIVNGQKTDSPFKPQQVQLTSQENGGVKADVVDVDPATIARYDPQNPQADASGNVQFPNVDLAEQLVNTIVAGYDFRANLKVFKANDELTKNLLDIFG